MQTVVIVVHLMIVLAMIGVVLLQKSEGGGLGMGGGGGGGFLSSRGTAARSRCTPWRRPTGRAARGRRRASGSEVAVTTTHLRAGFPALRFSAVGRCGG